MLWWDRLQYSWRSETGLVRSRNEDAVTVRPDLGLVVVADGVGGSNSGHVASRLAVEVIGDRFQRQPPQRGDPNEARTFVEAAVEEANAAIWEWSQRHEACAGMCTTVVAGFVGRNWLAYAHVGDSRLYLLRDGRLNQLSRDHSFIQDLVDRGFFRSLDEARERGVRANVLTRALGSSTPVLCSSDVVEIYPGDLFLFCTDGLTGMVPDTCLEQMLAAGIDQGLESLANVLVQHACECGGSDNITLVLLRA